MPTTFKEFGGRKTIVAPDGTQYVAERSRATDSTPIKALSRVALAALLDAGGP